MPMTVLICGSPADGFQIVGPFADRDDAESYAEDHSFKDWWVARIISPEAFAESRGRPVSTGRGRGGRAAVKLKQEATSMRENAEQEQRRLSVGSPGSNAELSPICDDGFARRAGKIIAGAAAHIKDTVHRRGKRR